MPRRAISPSLSRPIRWSLWLGLGVLFGLGMGFAAGLAQPRIRRQEGDDEVPGQKPDPARAERAIEHRMRN